MMQVYTPASFSVTSVIVRLSESMINLETKHSYRQFSATSDRIKCWSKEQSLATLMKKHIHYYTRTVGFHERYD